MSSHDALPEAILELVLLRVDSAPCLLRAAATCKRWRRIITSDVFRSLLKTPPVVAGSYSNSENGIFALPDFEPSPSAAIDVGHFSLDFLPGSDDAASSWTIKDSYGSLILFYREDSKTKHQDLFVCEPLTRRHVLIPPLNPPVRLSRFLMPAPEPVLLDASGDGSTIVGMSSFRVLRVVQTTYHIRAYRFTSGDSSWRETCINRRYGPYGSLVLRYVGVTAGRWYWHDGEKKVVTLDKSTLEFSFSMLPGDGDGHVILAVGRDGEARIVSWGLVLIPT
ncbi:unnamed protein product [Urochloa humidicola]